jgi:hypothetical protein
MNDLLCPHCGGKICPVHLIDGKWVIMVEGPWHTEIYAARLRCGKCGKWARFWSSGTPGVDKEPIAM